MLLAAFTSALAGETAGSAPEDGLALTRVPVHLPARRAALARVMRLDLLHPAGRLLLQAAHQQPPPGPQDLAVEPGLGADVPARVPRRAFRRSGHVLDLQVFDSDHVEAPRDVRAGLLHPVLAPVTLPGAQPGDRVPHPPAASRAGSRPGEPPLQAPQPLPLPRDQARHMQQLTRRQGRADSNAPVNAHHLAVAWRRDRIGNGREGDMPAPGPVHPHPVGLHPRRHRAGPAEPHPPGLRHPDLADLPGHPAHVPLPPAPPGDPEPFIPSGLAPRRPPGRVTRVEERGHRLAEVAQRLLLHRLGAGGQPRVLRSRLGELPALLQVARRAWLQPGRQWECCSTARFHTYRAWPQWSRSTASWAGVGSSRYLDIRTH